MSEHGGHGHGHMHHGGDGGSFSQALGVDQGHHGQHHGFLSHLLGLDGHDHGHHGHHQLPGGIDQSPQSSASWTSPLQGLKLEHALQGINVTPNTLFLFLFIGMGIWLYVVYFVRHHEPLANQVLGTGAAHSATAASDRHIVAGIRNAVPVRTGPTTGEIYVPNTPVISHPHYGTAPATVSTRGNYYLPVKTEAGLRLKTVVNR